MNSLCQNCGTETIEQGRVNRCLPCERVFANDTFDTSKASSLPAQFRVSKGQKSLRLSWPWMRKSERKYFPLVLLFDLAALIALVFVYQKEGATLSFFLLCIALLLPALGGTYDRLCVLLNRVVVSVDEEGLRIAHSPLLARASREFDADEFVQLYSVVSPKEKKARYSVRAVTFDDEIHVLVSDLESAEQAVFVERSLEEFLHIEEGVHKTR